MLPCTVNYVGEIMSFKDKVMYRITDMNWT